MKVTRFATTTASNGGYWPTGIEFWEQIWAQLFNKKVIGERGKSLSFGGKWRPFRSIIQLDGDVCGEYWALAFLFRLMHQSNRQGDEIELAGADSLWPGDHHRFLPSAVPLVADKKRRVGIPINRCRCPGVKERPPTSSLYWSSTHFLNQFPIIKEYLKWN